jgi:hypothetical protein
MRYAARMKYGEHLKEFLLENPKVRENLEGIILDGG